MLEYEFYMSGIFPHKDGIYESVFIWEYTGQKKTRILTYFTKCDKIIGLFCHILSHPGKQC